MDAAAGGPATVGWELGSMPIGRVLKFDKYLLNVSTVAATPHGTRCSAPVSKTRSQSKSILH